MALIPVDFERCQAEIPNGVGPFTLGGRHEMVRCKSPAVWVATENTPDASGVAGAMSLCSDCKSVLIKQLGADFATITALPDNAAAVPPQVGLD